MPKLAVVLAAGAVVAGTAYVFRKPLGQAVDALINTAIARLEEKLEAKDYPDPFNDERGLPFVDEN